MPREIVNTESFGRIADRMHFAQGVRANGFLFCSGVIGFDKATGRAHASAEDEFRSAFESIGELLGEAGVGFDEIVEMTTYHVAAASAEEHGANMAAFGKVRGKVKDESASSGRSRRFPPGLDRHRGSLRSAAWRWPSATWMASSATLRCRRDVSVGFRCPFVERIRAPHETLASRGPELQQARPSAARRKPCDPVP